MALILIVYYYYYYSYYNYLSLSGSPLSSLLAKRTSSAAITALIH